MPVDAKLQVVYIHVDDLLPNPHNSRTHSDRQIRQIKDSIKFFGFLNPVLSDAQNQIVAGHGRVAAAKLLGLEQIPTIRVEDLTPNQIRAYILADNKLAEKAGWDESILAIELQHLQTIDDFDVTITGFEVPEIDLLLAPSNTTPDPEDTFQVSDTETLTKRGDLWELGKHRILCGDATQQESYSRLMCRKCAGVVFIDPPYNVVVDGNVGNIGGKSSVAYREFQMAAGEMNEFEYTSFLTTSLKLLARHSTNGAVHFVCMDWRHVGELSAASKQVYESLQNICVWVKNTGGMGSFYRSRHELVFVFKNGKGQYRNNIQLGRYGRNRTNVWEYPNVNTLSKSSEEGNLLALHPTVKPVALIADALLDCSARGDVVLDAFLGSGSTLMAAERTGRYCYGIEIDPIYVDTAIKRWQRITGEKAVNRATGIKFDDVVKGGNTNVQ